MFIFMFVYPLVSDRAAIYTVTMQCPIVLIHPLIFAECVTKDRSLVLISVNKFIIDYFQTHLR